MSQVRLTQPGTSYPAYAMALARLAKEGKLPETEPKWIVQWSVPLGTPETQQTVQAELVDGQGIPRLVVTEILARAFRKTGKLDEWRGFLDGKVAAEGLSGDVKACWLLARGYVESIAKAHTPHIRYPLIGREWLDQALAAAESPSLRFRAVGEIVRGYAAIGRHDQGLAVLDSVAGQFADTDAAKDVNVLRKEIERAKVDHLAALARYKAEHAQRIAKARQRELKRRLAKARARGRRDMIERYEKLLQQ